VVFITRRAFSTDMTPGMAPTIAATRCRSGSSITTPRSTTATGGTPDYWLDPEQGTIDRNGTWATGRRIVKVTYTAGLGDQVLDNAAEPENVTSTVPEDLRLAAMIWVAATYSAGDSSWSTHIGDNMVIRPVAMPPQVRALVAPWARMR
jgi:hypothetical protein